MKWNRLQFGIWISGLMFACTGLLYAQIAERERPDSWNELVQGARFVDRFLPMQGRVLSSDTWGLDAVRPRWIDNGIESDSWSYWGGNILQAEDGTYHLFVCGWLEGSPRGHMEWGRSWVFNAVSDNLTGPFRPRQLIGRGHNPEAFRLKDGRYVIYVIDGCYIADDLNGPWQYSKLEFDARDRAIIEGLSNLSFARRDDGSFVMVCRGGGIWISKDGLSTYHQVSNGSVYPDVDGRFEDPVIWRDSVQYHLIVNDWLGRIAYYLRSPDGLHWVVDPGEAYVPGIARHADGTVEDWFKFERLKIFQDAKGRAIQANFAVIDTLKHEDRAFDLHSSKNIGIPLEPGLLLEIVDSHGTNGANGSIVRVRVKAEPGFDPLHDLDLDSLRLGACEAVNFGRGASVREQVVEGADVVFGFDRADCEFDDEAFVAKLIGRKLNGDPVFGFASLSESADTDAMLSPRAPVFSGGIGERMLSVEVMNLGQRSSDASSIRVLLSIDGSEACVAESVVPALQPYANTTVHLAVKEVYQTVELNPDSQCTVVVEPRSGQRMQYTGHARFSE